MTSLKNNIKIETIYYRIHLYPQIGISKCTWRDRYYDHRAVEKLNYFDSPSEAQKLIYFINRKKK